jgi:hypothetical protein
MATETAARAARQNMEEGGVALGRQIRIYPHAPLPDLDSPGAQAFAAEHAEGGSPLFAFICRSGQPERRDILQHLRAINHGAMLRLVEADLVHWPPDNARRMAIVLERPAGGRLRRDLTEKHPKMSEEDLTRRLIQPFFGLLSEFSGSVGFCGGIRPTNLFLPAGDSTGPFMVGDFFTAPASFHQPALFETPERAMTPPIGRGPAGISEDIYALGVTCLILAMGQNPLAGISDDEIIERKLEKGTYTAIIGAQRLPPNLIEPIRGMLGDSDSARWTLKDMDMWLSGRRLRPKQPDMPRRSARPFEMLGRQVWQRRSLSRLLGDHPGEAVREIAENNVSVWLKRSAGETKYSEAVEVAVATGRAFAKGDQEARVVARALIAMDPLAPIRYKNVSAMPRGIGNVLAEAYIKSRDLAPIAEMILAQLPAAWYQAQEEFKPEYAPWMRQFEMMRNMLERPETGQGLERVLYELNLNVACQSLGLKQLLVVKPEALLPALEEVSGLSDRPREPIDRHVAAFIGARTRGVEPTAIRALGETRQAGRKAAAQLQILAALQQRYGPENLPGLCGWMQELLASRVKEFHHRDIRDKLSADLSKASARGSLIEMRDLIGSQEVASADIKGFAMARRAYAQAEHQIHRLSADIESPKRIARGGGRQWAAVASGLLAALFCIIIILMAGGGGGH